MKKLLFLLFVASTTFSYAEIYNGTCGDNLTWSLNTVDSTLTIEGNGDMTNWWISTIVPWEEYNLKIKTVDISEGVTSIGENAFYGCYYLQEVSIPNTLVTIGAWAFSQCGVTSVTIPEHVESIGAWAFYYSWGMTDIFVDDANPYFSDENGVLFNKEKTTLIHFPENKMLSEYTIPNSVNIIYDGAFWGSKMYSIIIPDDVTTLGIESFTSCYNLTSISIPRSVTNIGREAFSYCKHLESITCKAITPPALEENVFYEVDKSIPVYVLEQSMDSYLAADQWKEFTNILSISGACVISSGACGAEGDNLTWELNYDGELTISGTGKMADYDSFSENPAPWYSFQAYILSVDIKDGVTSIGRDAFRSCSNLTFVTISNSVTEIGICAFCWCNELSSVIFPNSIISIGEGAFAKCPNLTSFEIPSGIEGIEDQTFNGCSSLISVVIPNSVTYIGYRAFYECTSLIDITIPSSVTLLRTGAFESCTGLTKLTSEAVIPPSVANDGFKDIDKSIPVYVPSESVELYQKATGWKDFTNIQADNNYTVTYVDKDANLVGSQIIQLDLPEPPVFAGFTFVKWIATSDNVKDGITIQAVYKADTPTSAPEVVTNPANPAQKLIRNGNIYILTGDKTYTVTGQEIR